MAKILDPRPRQSPAIALDRPNEEVKVDESKW
jgi:hypothetical protein